MTVEAVGARYGGRDIDEPSPTARPRRRERLRRPVRRFRTELIDFFLMWVSELPRLHLRRSPMPSGSNCKPYYWTLGPVNIICTRVQTCVCPLTQFKI